MALRTYRYKREEAAALKKINEKLPSTATQVATAGGHVVDYDIEETDVSDLDDVMSSLGFTNIATDPTDDPVADVDLPPFSAAEIYESNDTGTLYNLTMDVWAKWTSVTAGNDTGTALALADGTNNKIIIGADGGGLYHISAHMSVMVSNGSLTSLAVYLNGARRDDIRTADEKSSNKRLDLSCTGLLNLVSGDELELFFMMDTGTPSLTVYRANLNVSRGGGGSGGGGAGGHTIQDEGSGLPARSNINFLGTGVTAVDNAGNDATDVTIPGGGGGGPADQTVVVARRTTTYAATASWTDITFDATDIENDTSTIEHDNTDTDRIQIKETANYLIVLDAHFATVGSSDPEAQLKVNDSTVIPGSYMQTAPGSNNTYAATPISIVCACTAGDWISLQVKDAAASSTLQIDAALSIVQLKGTQGAQGPAGSGGGGASLFYADQLDNPVTGDWPVNALAPAVADGNNSGLTIRQYDDTTELGVGFSIFIPSGKTNIIIRLKSRADVGAADDVVPKLYNRDIPDADTITAWSSGTDLAAISMTVAEDFHYDEETISLSTLGATAGETVQFELTRNTGAGGDTLSGHWLLLEIQVDFS